MPFIMFSTKKGLHFEKIMLFETRDHINIIIGHLKLQMIAYILF